MQAVVRATLGQGLACNPAGRIPDRFAVGHLHAGAATHGDGLEVLGAHDRAEAGAARDLVEVVDDAGVADEVLAGGTNLGDADLLVAEFLTDRGFDRVR